MKKTLLATALLLASGGAQAATGEFCMFDGTGAPVNGGWATTCDEMVTATVDLSGSVNSVASPQFFFGTTWTAHSFTTYQVGTYSVDTIEGGIYDFTVGAGQIGISMLFNWGVVADIDVINIWDITNVGGVNTYTSTDWDGDGILGGAMIDGAFVGFSANFNLTGADLPAAIPVPAAVWLFGSGLIGLVGVARRRKAA
jgi:hypothetical protein